MQKTDKTKQELVNEINALRQRVADLETRSQQASSAFQHADDKYRNLFENAGDSIIIIDPATQQILDANLNASRRLGYTPEEFLRLHLDDIEIVSGGNAPDQQISWESTFSGARFYECDYRRKNGSLMPVEVSRSLTTTDRGQVLQHFVRDITKRREIEEARKRAELEREELIGELDAFAHTVAHDLKAPLSLICGYASLLDDRLVTFSPEELRESITAMLNGTLRMTRIIDELLLFASTRQLTEVEVEPLVMESIVNDCLAHLQFMVEERSAEIAVLDAASWPIAVGYAPWVGEVWTNYLSNAIKYGGTPPRIEVGATLETGDKVRFWVRDNGVGLPPEKQSQLFQMYSRLGQIRIQGHGLGLSIVQRIVSKLGGEVGVESTIGEGSTFSFTLPLSSSQELRG